MHAIRIEEHGGPEALRWQPVDRPSPGRGEVLVRLEAAGVNFIDVYQRMGLYAIDLPTTPGLEGAGVVVEIGEGAEGVAVGDRVAWSSTAGSYAEFATVPADRLAHVPDDVDLRVAAAAMLQGMTAHYLTHDTYPLAEGDVCLVHAVAGGVGLLLTQLAKRRGAVVIGTASTEAKAARAREAGADHVVLYTEEDFTARARELTGGRGVQAVYDSVGRDTFDGSLDALAPRGTLVLYGQSSGPVGAFDPQVLNRKGSLFLTRPSLVHHIADRAALERRAGEVLGLIAAGGLAVHVDSTLPMADASEAHRRLEARETSGKVLLVPAEPQGA